MIVSVLCPICRGCGRISYDLMGNPVPQQSWTSYGTAGGDPPKCLRCDGIGTILKEMKDDPRD